MTTDTVENVMHDSASEARLPARIAMIAALCMLSSPARADAGVQPGTYRCWSYNVSGGGGTCRLAPPIVINPDGTYQESRTSGTYQASGGRITFSESKIRGSGHIADHNRIVFEYDYNGRRHTVTYLCQECNPIK
ncbi:MAG TPA: hypothetical protein VEC06_00090 [Paucimonas sp.]|nr:hypothetical protein [Paucimonas sp.]